MNKRVRKLQRVKIRRRLRPVEFSYGYGRRGSKRLGGGGVQAERGVCFKDDGMQRLWWKAGRVEVSKIENASLTVVSGPASLIGRECDTGSGRT